MLKQNKKKVKIAVEFDSEKNIYRIKLNDKEIELSREDAVNFQRNLTQKLKSTPVLNLG